MRACSPRFQTGARRRIVSLLVMMLIGGGGVAVGLAAEPASQALAECAPVPPVAPVKILPQISGDTTCCPPMDKYIRARPNQTTFTRTLALQALGVTGGCTPTYYWSLLSHPAGLVVTPAQAQTTAPTLTITAVCPAAKAAQSKLIKNPKTRQQRRANRATNKSINAALHNCVGPVDYSVYASDGHTSTGLAHAVNNWCVANTKKGEICTRQLNPNFITNFANQSLSSLRDGLVKIAWQFAPFDLENGGMPGIGGLGKVGGKARDIFEKEKQANEIYKSSKDDLDNAEKAADAASADPPNTAVTTVTLPSLPGRPAAADCPVVRDVSAALRAECEHMAALLAAYDGDLASVTALTGAELLSQDRFSTSYTDGNSDANALQHAVTGILLTQLSPDVSALDSAGLAYVRAAVAYGLIPRTITAAELSALSRDVHAIRVITPTERQELDGVSIDQLRALLSALLSREGDKSFSVLGIWGRPSSPTALYPGWVAPGEVEDVVDQLGDQGVLTSAEVATLTNDLVAIESAADASDMQTALAQFASDGAAAGGETGSFLTAAEQALASEPTLAQTARADSNGESQR